MHHITKYGNILSGEAFPYPAAHTPGYTLIVQLL